MMDTLSVHLATPIFQSRLSDLRLITTLVDLDKIVPRPLNHRTSLIRYTIPVIVLSHFAGILLQQELGQQILGPAGFVPLRLF